MTSAAFPAAPSPEHAPDRTPEQALAHTPGSPLDGAPKRQPQRSSSPAQATLWPSGVEASIHGVQPHPLTPGFGFEERGWRIGWDHALWGLTPPHDHLHPGNPVREGWFCGRQALRRSSHPAAPGVEDLLALRLQCWREGRDFDAHSVTPRLLARIRPEHCPVTRQPLGPGRQGARAIVLHRAAACAAGNIAFVQARVADIAHGLRLDQAIERARKAQVAGQAGAPPGTLADLQAAQWWRLASLISMATPMSHEQAAALPLHLLPPLHARVLNPEHALQVLLGSAAALSRAAGAAALDALGRAVPAGARRSLYVLCSALLARRLQVPAGHALQVAHAIEDAWSSERVAHCWGDFIGQLSREQCEAVVAQAAPRVRAGRRCWRVLALGDATDGWALDAAPAQIFQS